MVANLKLGIDTRPGKKAIKEVKKELEDLAKVKPKVSVVEQRAQKEAEKAFDKEKKVFDKKTKDLEKQKLIHETILDQIHDQSREAKKLSDEITKGNVKLERREAIEKRLVEIQQRKAKLRRDEQRILDRITISESTLGQAPTAPQLPDPTPEAGPSKTAAFGKMFGKLLGAGGAMALTYAISRGMKGAAMYEAGAGTRVQLRGMGINGVGGMSDEALARAGLTQNEFLQRRLTAAKTLGRGGADATHLLRQAEFERARGLDEGSLLNMTTGLRATMGVKGAEQAVIRMQASILANGIEDALAPFLETTNQLLHEINANGMTQTDDMIRIFGQMVKSGPRTPEQIAASFRSADAALRGATGERSALFQMAFARAGIGGNTIGGANFALQQGLFGLDPASFRDRISSNDTLFKSLTKAGQFAGPKDRAQAILDTVLGRAGLSGKKVGDIKNDYDLYALSNFSNQMFGTENLGGMDLLRVLEDMTAGKGSIEEFERRQDELRVKSPEEDLLAKINETLEGQTTYIKNLQDNAFTSLGVQSIIATNTARLADIFGIQTETSLLKKLQELFNPDEARPARGARTRNENTTTNEDFIGPIQPSARSRGAVQKVLVVNQPPQNQNIPQIGAN